MTASKKIFFDTAPFIYVLENHRDFYNKVAGFILESIRENSVFETSVLSYTEFCVKPQEKGRPELISDFETLLRELNFSILEVNFEAAKIAYKLRAKYKFLKGIDALQISIALHSKCQKFLTNDKKLSGVTEIEVIIVEDLPG